MIKPSSEFPTDVIELLKISRIPHPIFLKTWEYYPGPKNEIGAILKKLNRGGKNYFNRYIRENLKKYVQPTLRSTDKSKKTADHHGLLTNFKIKGLIPSVPELLQMQIKGIKEHNLERISYHWKRLVGLTFFFSQECSPPMGTYKSEPTFATDLMDRKPATIMLVLGTFYGSGYVYSIEFATGDE